MLATQPLPFGHPPRKAPKSTSQTRAPPEERQQVFEPFYRAEHEGETAKPSPGVGLGLTICKSLIEAQGGRVWIDDRPGAGTTVSFTLPIVGPARSDG
jgi:signal transduction histidine kinase